LDQNKKTEHDIATEFILNMMTLTDRLGTPSIELTDDLEKKLLPIVGDDDPQHIAGGINFFRFSEILYRIGNPTMSDLSHQLSVPQATMTRLVEWWVDKGLAERLADPGDRRVIRITLTASGGKFYKVLKEFATRQVKIILGGLTDKEQVTFINLLRKLTS